MLLNSPAFILFLLGCTALHALLPAKLRRGFLLLASAAYCCSFHPAYLLLPAALVLLCHRLALRMEAADDAKKSRLCTAGIVFTVALLAGSKFSHLWAAALLSLLGGSADLAALFAPIGISYYSFTLIGYLVDVKKGRCAAEKSLLSLALFAVFFPQLMAGPIARTAAMLPQWQQPKTPCYSDFVQGAQRFFKGAVYKVMAADGIAILINGFYADPAYYDGLLAWFAFFAYPLQLYFDFAGYSDMAIGAARMMGYHLQENFASPYLAASFGEFWSRWHMGLSTWLRDYIYFPLGGSRCSTARTCLNLMAVFVLSGVWHGVSVGYLIWGALTGVARVLERLREQKRDKDAKLRSVFLARLGVYLTWAASLLFFRAENGEKLLQVLGRMFTVPHLKTAVLQLLSLAQNGVGIGTTYYLFFFGSLLMAGLFCLWADGVVYSGEPYVLRRVSEKKRMALYMVFGVLIMLFYFLVTSGNSDVSFIYVGY